MVHMQMQSCLKLLTRDYRISDGALLTARTCKHLLRELDCMITGGYHTVNYLCNSLVFYIKILEFKNIDLDIIFYFKTTENNYKLKIAK